MQQKILGISGKKQSGKNTLTNFVVGLELMGLGVVRGGFVINEKGELWIPDMFGDTEFQGILDLSRNNPEFLQFMDEHVYPHVKVYSFADLLKKEVCIKILGLTYEQCFGSDADKNTLVPHLLWENFPGTITPNQVVGPLEDQIEDASIVEKLGLIVHEAGPMTAREALQMVGTEIFRKMYSNVWVDATLKQIQQENSAFALICDLRFPNEVDGVKAVGGKTVRLTRDPNNGNDKHSSETALDNYDVANYDKIIDNKTMSIDAQNRATHDYLLELGWAEPIKIEQA